MYEFKSFWSYEFSGNSNFGSEFNRQTNQELEYTRNKTVPGLIYFPRDHWPVGEQCS